MIEASCKDIKRANNDCFLICIFIWTSFAFFFQQAVHVNSHVAFMFVLALASVNLASADSASKTVSVEKSFVFHDSVNLLSKIFKKNRHLIQLWFFHHKFQRVVLFGSF